MYLGACNIACLIGDRVSDRVDAAVSGATAFCSKHERCVVCSLQFHLYLYPIWEPQTVSAIPYDR
jgi:hypothetical protein